MKLKYYLRGLSIGILFATIVLSISFRTNSKIEITDEEIIKQAEELGMIMKDDNDLKLDQLLNGLITPTVPSTDIAESASDSLSDTDIDSKNPDESTTQPESTTTSESTIEPTLTVTPSVKLTPTAEPTPTVDITIAPTIDVVEDDEYVTFEILSGMTSYEVSRLLKNSDLIDDVWKFNRYMVENEYVKIINLGTYKIKKGSSYQEIAREIIIE